MSRARYATMFLRLVANSRLAVEDDAHSCWLWTGSLRKGYPSVGVRREGRCVSLNACRVMLEEVHQIDFPFDEAGHLCNEPLCINPAHLEVQTRAHNLCDRRGYAANGSQDSWIPILFPRIDPLQLAADRAWDSPGEPSPACPF